MSLRGRMVLAAASIPAFCGIWVGSCSGLMAACPPLKEGWHLLPGTISVILAGAGAA